MINQNDPIFLYTPLFGAFQVEALLGEGSYGRVYRVAREDITGRYESAVKHIRIPLSNAELKEAQLFCTDAASLTHYFEDIAVRIVNEVRVMYTLRGQRNIVTYEDHAIFHEENSLQWDVLIRMELLEPLAQYMQRQPLNTTEVCALGMDIASALAACGQRGIIHRDIKDGNIFVAPDGTYKLGDFGVAKNMSEYSMSMRGTPVYLAPEVFNGQPYDATVDIYSLGILLYKLLNNGRYPFLPAAPARIGYSDIEKAFVLRMQGKPLPPPAHGSEALHAIVQKACSHDAALRYQSADALKEALLAVLHDTPTVVHTPTQQATVDTPPDSTMGSAPYATDISAAVLAGTKTGEETLCITNTTLSSSISYGENLQAMPLQYNEDSQAAQLPQQASAIQGAQASGKTQKWERLALYALLGIATAGIALALLFQGGQQSIENEYADALAFVETGAYADALEILSSFEAPFEESDTLAIYTQACQLMESGSYANAANEFLLLGEFRDSAEQYQHCIYQQALQEYEAKKYPEAQAIFQTLGAYQDAPDMAQACAYALALEEHDKYRTTGSLQDAKNAMDRLSALGDYQNAPALLEEIWEGISQQGANALQQIPDILQNYSEDFAARVAEKAAEARIWYESIPQYKNSAALIVALDALQDVLDMQGCYAVLIEQWDTPVIQEILLSNYFLGYHLDGKWEGTNCVFYHYTDPAKIQESFSLGLPYLEYNHFSFYYQQYGIPVNKEKGKYGAFATAMSVHGALQYYIANKTLYTGHTQAWWKPSLTFEFPSRDSIVVTDRINKVFTLQRVA